MASLRRRNTNTMMVLVGLVAGMIGLAYASVPLYNLFCRVTGFDGTPRRADTGPAAGSAIGREVTVTFTADVNRDMPWLFRPEVKSIVVKVGEPNLAYFIAENPTGKPITGSATFNISPDVFAPYFVKVQCFCFSEQTLAAGEKVRMPVSFYLDPALASDKLLDRMSNVTLSYTFFRAVDQPVTTGAKAATPAATTAADTGSQPSSSVN